MKKTLVTFSKNFMKCGLTGWCMEIIFTSLYSLRRRDMTLKGVTSIWMFPIYGCAALISPLSKLLQKKPAWFRGFTYMSMIFSTEYLTGRLLTRHSLCPWDYSKSKWNVNRVIRLDYAPYWFGAGLLFEHLLSSSSSEHDKQSAKTLPQ
ncbi:MAG: putative ABC transporter permease [Lachnospiraceae bacterium]|nr:putative ABC transporter permease [Lachnospiraceae bacterium]